MTEQRYTLEEAKAELARRECRVTGHLVGAVTFSTLDGTGPITYQCGRCSDEWMIPNQMVAEGPFTLRLPLGVDDDAYRKAARDVARNLGLEVAGPVRMATIDVPGSAAAYRRIDMTLVHRDRKMVPAPTDDSWITMDRLERPTT